MNRKVRIATAAVVVTAAAAATVIGVTHVGDESFTVTAQFEDTVGLYQGNAVSILGMQVGKVTSIVPKGTYVEVKFDINHGVNVPADVQAVTVSTSILTDRHIELTPAYQSGPKLKNGDVVGLGRTRTPVEFDRTLSMVDKLSNALKGDSKGGGPVADLLNLGHQMATRSGPELRTTLDQLSQALRLGSDNGAQSKKDIQAIVTSLSDLTQSAADNDTTIREFGANLHQLSDVIAAQNLGTGTTGAKVNQILEQATSLLEKNRAGLKGTVTDFTAITKAMVDYRRELSEFFDVAPLAIDNVYNAIDPVAGSIRAHGLGDKLMFDSQLGKEICNLINKKQLGCATGTAADYGPDFGLDGMFKLMAGERP